MSLVYIWGATDWTYPSDTKPDAPDRVLDFPMYLPVTLPAEVTSVACGAKFTLLLLKSNAVYGFGNNEWGQLGIPQTKGTVIEQPTLVFGDEHVVQIAAGYAHSMCLTSQGTVFTTGDNGRHQLGNHRGPGIRSKWVAIQMDKKVTCIAAGKESSYAVTNTGELLSWGSMRKGCLGHGLDQRQFDNEDDISTVSTPKPVDDFLDRGVRIQSVAAGQCHFVALTTSGDVYTCGDGLYGKLGQNSIETCWTPVQVTFPFRKNAEVATYVGAGGDITYVLRQCAVLGTIVYQFGRIGGDFLGMLTPELMHDICGQDVSFITGGGKTQNVSLTKDGKIFVWGKNNKSSVNGILGDVRNKVVVPHEVELLQPYHVVAAGVGSHHTVIAANVRDPKTPFEIRVPLAGRYGANINRFGGGNEKKRFEIRCNEYRLAVLGDAAGTAYNAKLPPMEEELTTQYEYRKVGAHSLTSGSKVKVWVENVYAWGTIIKRIDNELTPKRAKFLMRWLREDWFDEEVELVSDDETEDPSNPDRWQYGWVHDAS